MLPTYLCAAPNEQIGKLGQELKNPAYSGVLVNAPMSDPSFLTLAQQIGAAPDGMPFEIRIPMLPAPPALSTVTIAGQATLCCWDPAVATYRRGFIANMFDFLTGAGLMSRCQGIVWQVQPPYDWDDEDGLKLNTADHGTADLQAAGFPPQGYIQAHIDDIAWLNTLPAMQGLRLSWRPFTAGDPPRFDLATGLPGDNADPFAYDNAIADALDGYTAGPTAYGYTRWSGAALNPFQQSMANRFPLILQTETGMTPDQVQAAIAAASALNPLRVEVHTGQMG